MEKRLRVLTVLLAVSIVASVYSSYRVSQLEMKVSRLEGDAGNTIRSEIGGVRAAVSGILEDQRESRRWTTPVKTEILEIAGNTCKVRLSWQIKEYPQGSLMDLF